MGTADDILGMMKETGGGPVSRDDYINLVYGNDLPEEWTPEHEEMLPEELQDWQRFEMRGIDLVEKQQYRRKAFDPDEPRDESGRWTDGGGSDSTGGDHPGHGYSKEARVDAKGVIHTSNVHDAARALFEGKKVALNQPREVATLLNHLGQISKVMIKLGGKAPNLNLCNVSVAGSNLFCAQSKGIPRVQMPQLTDEQTAKFPAWLGERGYKVTSGTEIAAYLRATQNELNGAKVARTAEYFRTNPQATERPIIVSRDNYILDGHHSWAAKIGLDAADGILTNDKPMNIRRVDIDIIDLLKRADEFTGGAGKVSAQEKRRKGLR